MERSEIKEKLRLQLITQKSTPPEVLKEVRLFLEGGGRWVQLRMKDTDEETVIETGKTVLDLCRSFGAMFLVNDSPEVASEIDADGVHLGKTDMNPIQTRLILGDGKIIGRTANTIDDIRDTAQFPVDYIGLGPFRFTTTKKNLSPVLGPEGYRQILRTMTEEDIDLPLVAIGGIGPEDIETLNACGVRFYAVSGSISKAPDPTAATKILLQKIKTEST